MFRNYLAAALRNLVRNRLYAAINVAGLAIGFAAALLIGLFVRDELTYDTWVPGHENVFRLAKSYYLPNGRPDRFSGSNAIEALWFKQDLPQVAAAARLWPEQRGIRHGAVEGNETIAWTDPEFFEVFPLTAIDGETAGALSQPDTVAITRAMARKYFQRENVVGETIEVDRKYPMRVTVVLEDPPSRSHLDIGILVSRLSSISPLVPLPPMPAGIGDVFTYLRLVPNGLNAVQEALVSLTDRHVPPISSGTFVGLSCSPCKWGESGLMKYDLQPLADIHMLPARGEPPHYGLLRPAGDSVMAAALSVTGGLILLIAAANFTNLMTARAGRRAVEIGVRKVSGALRRQLIAQFVGESFLYVMVSFAVAAVAVWIFLPSFNTFLGRGLDVTILQAHVAAAILGVVVIVGLLGGFYPALVLSAYRPATVLKGDARGTGGSALLRQTLVVAQFAVLIGLIVATIVIARQTTLAMNNGFRMNTDQLLFVATPCRDAFKDKVTALPGVRGTSCVGTEVLSGLPNGVSLQLMPDGTQFTLSTFRIGPGLLELYGLKPLAGRFPDSNATTVARGPGEPPRRSSWVINETATRRFGFTSPEAAIGQRAPGGDTAQNLAAEIVGVVPDFPMRSLHEPIVPSAYTLARNPAYLVAKLDGNQIGETLAAIDKAWEEANPAGPIRRQFYDQHVQAQYTDMLRQSQAFIAFAVTAVVIACLGLFGLSAFTAEQRTKEIGVRKSMGATHSDIVTLLLWQFAKPVLLANLIAWPAGYFVMRYWLDGFAYRIDLSPWMFLIASALALIIAIATVIGHALLIARAQPVTALRYE